MLENNAEVFLEAINTTYSTFSNSVKFFFDRLKTSETKYTGACFLTWPSSFSCRSATLRNAKLPHIRAMEPLAKVELNQSSITSTLRRLFAEPGLIERLRLTSIFQRMADFSLLI
jgi:hypothetical protein